MNVLKLFGYKWTHRGELQTKVVSIIPFFVYLSASKIKSPGRKSGGHVYALHLTPWFTIGVNGVSKEVQFDE